jgi:MFS family permease
VTEQSTLDDDQRQRSPIAVAATANKGTAILMGTVMAVYIGRVGSPFAVSLVFTVYWFGLMVGSPLLGAIADITGRRRVILIVTAALATLAILPLSVVDSIWAFLTLRGIFAIFAAGFLPVILTIVSERGGTDSRGQSLGFVNGALAIGSMGGQLLAGTLLGVLVPRGVYLVTAGIGAVGAIASAFIVDPRADRTIGYTLGGFLTELRTRLVPRAGERRYLRSHGLRWLYIAVLLRNMTVLGISSLLPIYLVADVGVSEVVMGAVLAINPLAQMVFMYLFGRATDAIGRKPLIVAGMAGSGIYALIMAAAILPAALVGRIVGAAFGMIVIGAAFSAKTTGSYAFIGDVAPDEHESKLMGLYSTARGLAVWSAQYCSVGSQRLRATKSHSLLAVRSRSSRH